MAATPALYLDDIQVGLRFTTGTHPVDQAQIIDFASAFDPQPFHTDPEAAQGSVFQGLAASGWHTAAITMRLLVQDGAPIAGGIVGAGTELTWPRPTRPGDVLRVASEVVKVTPSRSRPDRGTVTLRSETLNQDDQVVQIQVATLMVPRRPGAADATPARGRGESCCAA
jgi:acyl dehydratase